MIFDNIVVGGLVLMLGFAICFLSMSLAQSMKNNQRLRNSNAALRHLVQMLEQKSSDKDA